MSGYTSALKTEGYRFRPLVCLHARSDAFFEEALHVVVHVHEILLLIEAVSFVWLGQPFVRLMRSFQCRTHRLGLRKGSTLVCLAVNQ